MDEIVSGIFHWTAFHERIRQDVSSYCVAPSATLVDPMLPEDGIEWFRERQPPARILLTNRHHYRHSARFVEAFGCPVLCHEAGLHEFEGGPDVEGFAYGEEPAAGIVALEVGAICPEDAALHIAIGQGLLAFADGLIRRDDGALAFVPDFLMGDDAEGVKRGLRRSLSRLVERDFDSLLFAHGKPLVGGGKAALEEFLR
jgi:hypothetical protein